MYLLPAIAGTPTRNVIHNLEAMTFLRSLPSESVHCMVTSPPYWGLRDYGVAGQLGMESTLAEYISNMVALFREARRVLRSDGVLWLNMGDGYATSPNGRSAKATKEAGKDDRTFRDKPMSTIGGSLKPKDLMMQPHRLAIALQDDGWWVRSDCVWCLSGGTYVYARTQKGDSPMMIRDVARLKPETVKLWNGEKWTQVLGWSKTPRAGDELEIVLRSGERISCTPNHQFPTHRGLLNAEDLAVGDFLQRTQLPEPETSLDPAFIGEEAAWLAGLYLAEGSRSDDMIQIAGHAKEEARWERIKQIAEDYGGSATRTINGNNMSVRVAGKMLLAIIDMFISGRTAKDKCLNPIVWRYGNSFLRAVLDGYLNGDGHYDAKNNRWRLGFTRNYNLERDLRTLSARLGFRLVLKMTTATHQGGTSPAFRGEIRFSQNEHPNKKDVNEIVEIRKARCREVYDIGVEDEPHLFALTSGILTHNCKPNPMPESVTDRPTKAHEYVFLLTKSERYWYDAEPVKTPVKPSSIKRRGRAVSASHKNAQGAPGQAVHSMFKPRENAHRNDGAGTAFRETFNVKFTPKQDALGDRRLARFNERYDGQAVPMANLRSVWVIPAKGFKGAHFATFPIELPKICILTGCPPKTCAECGAPYVRVKKKQFHPELTSEHNNRGAGAQKSMDASNGWQGVPRGVVSTETLGWKPSCTCDTTDTRPGVVLDMFMGSGTTAVVAKLLKRDYIGSELNPEYIKLAEKRIARPRRQRFEESSQDDLPPLLQLIQQVEGQS